MKNTFFLLGILVASQICVAQDRVVIDKGTSFTTSDNVHLVLDELDLANEGVIKQQPGDGRFIFTGFKNNSVTGRGAMIFDRLTVDKKNGSKLQLESDLSIKSLLELLQGKLDLGNHVIQFGSTGQLKGENDFNYVFSTASGYLEALADLQRPVAVNPGNLGANITSAATPGVTVVRRGHSSQPGYSGKATALRYFDILPVNNQALNATMRFTYIDPEMEKINEADAVLVKNEAGGGWTNIGFDLRDGSGNFLEKKGIDQFSRITISTPSPYSPGETRSNRSLPQNTIQGEEVLAFKIWPNPVISNATLAVQVSTNEKMRLLVFDAKGAVVKTQEQILLPGKNQFQVNLSDLPQGNYSIQAKWGNSMRIIKLDKM